MDIIQEKAKARLLAKVRQNANVLGCWEWQAYRDPSGYGKFSYLGEARFAHIIAYLLFVGEVPEGLELDHRCHNTSCVNPDHLEPVTHSTNMLRGNTIVAHYAARTHCKHGHLLETLNGRRFCRTCKTRQYKECLARKRARAQTAIQRPSST